MCFRAWVARMSEQYLWRPRGVQSRSSGGQPHTGTGGMSWWRSFQTADDDGGLGFGGQQSPHRSEVFWEGLFLVLNARPPMGADGHRFSPNSPNLLLPFCCFSFLPDISPLVILPPAPITVRSFTWNRSSWILPLCVCVCARVMRVFLLEKKIIMNVFHFLFNFLHHRNCTRGRLIEFYLRINFEYW